MGSILEIAARALRSNPTPEGLEEFLRQTEGAWCDKPEQAERWEKIRQLARGVFVCDGNPEIDEDAVVSEGDDNGAYVAAWVWVPFSGTDLDKEDQLDCNECENRGWAILQRSDGRHSVQRCDSCQKFQTDEEAAAVSGLPCKKTYPCVIDEKDIPPGL
jgi:hypothetical protein